MSSQKYDFLANDVSAVLEAVNPHITDENRETVLGSTVMQFYRGGSTSSLVFLAVCADLLRVTIDCLFADDTLSEQECKDTYPFIKAVAPVFSKLRNEYKDFATISENDVPAFLNTFQSDSGPFGYLDESTKWSGVTIVWNVEDIHENSTALSLYRQLILQFAELLTELSDLSEDALAYMDSLRKMLDTSPITGLSVTPDTSTADPESVAEIEPVSEPVAEEEDSTPDISGENLETEPVPVDDTDNKYYLNFRAGTGRLEVQCGQKMHIRYSHSGWFGNASAGVEINVLDEEEGSEGIKDEAAEISGPLYQNILRFIQKNINQVFDEAAQGQAADCGMFDLTEILTGTELEWSDVIDQCGAPRSASSSTDAEWEQAKQEGRALSVVYMAEDEYLGVIGQFPDSWDRLIFDNPLPTSDGWVKGYDNESVIQEASEEKESQGNATEELFSAIQNGDIAAAESALNNGAEIDHQHEEQSGNTPILAAVDTGNTEMVRLVASHGPDFSITNWEDRLEAWLKARVAGNKEVADVLVENGAEEKPGDALTHAATFGSLELATAVLDEGADVDGGRWGTPPILNATSNGHADIVELLVERGVNIHADEYGMNAYIAAFSHGFFELAERAKELGCTVDEGYALLYSARFAHLPAIEAIIATGIDINSRREYLNDQTTAIEQAITSHDILGEEEEKADKRLEVVTYLLENGADPNTLDDDGKPVLHLAIANSYNDTRVMMALIEHGADTSIPDKETGQTPFFQVFLRADGALLSAFLTTGVDITTTDPDGNTALHLYFKENSYVDINFIRGTVALGAPLEATNNDGKNILDVLNDKRSELDDEYAMGQLDEVIELLSDESISSFHGILSREASSPEELVSQAQAHVEILGNHESASDLLFKAHEQGHDLLPLLGEQLQSDNDCWRKTAITVLGKIGLDSSSAQALQERYTNEWNDEIKILIQTTLEKGGFELPLDPTTLTTLDVETARKVVSLLTEDDEWLLLNSLSELSAEVAGVLIAAPCNLLLDQLESVPDDAMDVLSRHQYPLSLDGLLSLSETAATSLAGHSQLLYLNGLTDLELPVAQALSQRIGPISMGGISTLSEEVAQTLANTESIIHLGLTELEDSPGHLALLTKLALQDNDLILNGLSSLTDDVAAILATHKMGKLSLEGITTLSAELAAVLAQHKGETLGLDGLVELSLEAATALGSYEQNLWLDGLQEISAEAAAALAGKQVQLTLNGIAELSADVAKALASHQGELLLNQVLSISDEAAAEMARHHGGLSMTNLENISNEAAEQLKDINDPLALQLEYIKPDSSAEILRQKVEGN